MDNWLARLWIRVRRIRSNADVEEELRIHLDMAAEENLKPGISPVEARRRASVQLGSAVSAVEQVGDQEFTAQLEGWYRDFVYGLRAIRRTPVFSLTAILTLAFGIGANTAIFTLLYGLLLRSLPTQNPGELADIKVTAGSANDAYQSAIPYRMTEEYRLKQHSFTDISFWDSGTVNMADAEGTLRLYNAGLVSGNAFTVIGLRPYLGRWILPSEDVRGGPAGSWPVVLAYGFWNERFAHDPKVIGKRINVSGSVATIIGVAPRGFEGVLPGVEMKLYFPLRFASIVSARDLFIDPSVFYWCSAIGRLRPGVTVEAANAEAGSMRKELFRKFVPLEMQHLPEVEKSGIRVSSARSGLPTALSHEYSEPLLIMQGLVAVVLVLCCVNVGGLMMARVYVRQREFSVRRAIGAARWRLVRQYLIESFVIAIAGAALGGAAAWFGSPALLRFFRDPMMFEAVSIRPDATVFWITGIAAVATTLLCGTLPALHAGRSDPGVLLKSRTVQGLRRTIAGQAFVPVQAALSLVLVAVAALLSESLVLIRSQHKGFDVDHVTIQTPPFHRLPQRGNAKLDVYQRMVDRLEQMPGMRSAAVTYYTPMSGGQSTGRFRAVARNGRPSQSRPLAFNFVGPGYFRTIETHILQGREFTKNERKLDVCVLNQAAAAYLFPDQSAVGRYVRNEVSDELETAGACRVIGIAEDAKFATLRDAAPRTIYYPVSVQIRGEVANLVFLMNSVTEQQAIDGYRKALGEIAPAIPLVLFVTLRDQMDASLGSQRLITALSNLFAGLALFLCALGIYGLLSSQVVQRTGEIGIRMALGAKPEKVLLLIVSEAGSLLGAGVLLGIAGFFVAVGFVEKMLFGVSKFDPLILLASLALLAVVMFLAAVPPALRAASIDPIRALRTE